jgi:predicted DNA-binding transcriptional regulator AlpA
MTESSPVRWYSTDQLAQMLGIDASSLRRWRTTEPLQGPPFVRLSARRTIYNAADVEAWLKVRRVDPAA